MTTGAGKTTLLNYLSGRDISTNLKKDGDVFVNGVNKKQVSNFSAFSAYVQQDDILFQTMTVKECLTFAAKLKLPGPLEGKLKRVADLIEKLKLKKCENTRIGGPLVKGVSGGERKRTSIGVELITDPNLIFLDEPTTGLDSWTATQVIQMLKRLAHVEGKTVISTIHQPNTETFDEFDQLLLIARGKVIFHNDSKLSVEYFKSIEFSCPNDSNPADYFMNIMSRESIIAEIEDKEINGEKVVTNQQDVDEGKAEPIYAETEEQKEAYIYTAYEKRIEYFDINYRKSDLCNDWGYQHPDATQIDTQAAQKMQPWCFQWKLLARRNFNNIIRLPQTSYMKLLTTVCTGIFISILFWQSNLDTSAGWQNIKGSLFFMTMNTLFVAIQNVILIFPEERPVFLREVNNNMYNVTPYFWAKIFSELPYCICLPVIFGSITYFSIGLNKTAEQFFLFLIALIFIFNASTGYAMVIATTFSNKQVAVTLTPVLIIPFMLFAGFFSTNKLPYWTYPIAYLSIYKYGYQALYRNEFYNHHMSDEASSIPCGDWPETSSLYCSWNQIPNTTYGLNILGLVCIYIATYGFSLWNIVRLSKDYNI